MGRGGYVLWKFFIVFFVISTAYADGSAQQAGGWMSFLPMVAFIAVIYFLLIRPQQKRTKQHQALVAVLKKGDKVVTSSGIMATVSKVVSDQEIVLEIADGVHCRFVKSSVSCVVPADKAAQSDRVEKQAIEGKTSSLKEPDNVPQGETAKKPAGKGRAPARKR
jgi:preprotein translocase subunit YajC